MTPLELRCVEAMARAMFIDGEPDRAPAWDRAIADPRSREVVCSTWLSMARAALVVLLAELDATGWQVVPKEATREMVLAAIDRPADPDAIMYGPIYRAMLASAPKPCGDGDADPR